MSVFINQQKIIMKHLLLLLIIPLFIVSCQEEDNVFDTANERLEDHNLDIKTMHDNYCQQLCSSMAIWESEGLTNDQIIEKSYLKFSIQGPAEELGITENEVRSIHTSINLSLENYTTYGDYSRTRLTELQTTFLDDLLNEYANLEEDSEILDMLEIKKVYWSNRLNPSEVSNVIEIAKSSFIFWQHNTDSCILRNQDLKNNDTSLRADPCKVRIAGADLTGALFGSWGGPVGAIFGALGGTIGSATIAILTGGC